MAGITAGGIGSGLDIESIVRQLMSLEARPLNQLQQKKSAFQSQISSYGTLKSSLSTFQDALAALKDIDSFEVYKATSADEDVFTASAGSSAASGTFDIVVNNLAEAHKMASGSMADTATVGGSGDTVQITIGSESFTVDGGAKTLSQLRDAINDASDNIGVTASIISETSGNDRLILTSDDEGVANTMSLSFTGTLGTDLGMTTINTAEDSSMLVDGLYTITRSTNTITDAIEGVTINLKSESASAVNLAVTEDTDSVKESVQEFVDAYNALRTSIDSLYDGKLKGDSTLRSVENDLRNILNTEASLTTGYTFLSQVGITIGKDNKMTLDSTELSDAISTDFNAVAQLFANDDQGYTFRLDSIVDDLLDSDGTIDSRTDGLDARIDRIDNQISGQEYRLERIETRLRKQFAALDSLIGQMQSTSSFLANQLTQQYR